MQTFVGSAARKLAYAIGFAASALLAACGGGGDGPAPQGTLKMSMTDAPSCYRNVFVTVEKVRVHKGNNADTETGWEEIVPPNGPVRIDLLNLTNGALADLGSAQVDAGEYHHLRLVLSGAAGANEVVLLDGTRHELKTPSAQQSGLKIKTNFDVPVDGTTEMLLDFDACKSVVLAGKSGQYILKPVVRLGEKVAGSIQGSVTTTLSLTATSVTAYLNGEAVRATVPDSAGQFKLAYLEPGSYTVVITSPDRATAVVLDVPVVGTAATTLGTGAISPPASTMHTVSGTVTEDGDPVGEATVMAWQALAGNRAVLVNSTAVDFDLGTYQLKLPTADPVVATYAAGALAFGADTTAAGVYTLKATAPGLATLSQDVDTRAAATSTVDFAY